MARKIQSQSSARSGAKGFGGLLGNAIFWLVVAIVVPVKAIVGSFPELAAFAPWAPIILYGLAALSFVRAVRVLLRAASTRQQPASASGRPSGGSARPADLRGMKATTTDHGLPTISRKPTVQRMR
jgi:hypothetical protein